MQFFEALIFLTDGFEEVEAVTTIDILRRGNISVKIVSLTGKEDVIGSHNISIKTEAMFENIELYNSKMLILPGGPGHNNYREHQGLMELLVHYNDSNKYLAAICAAPSILGELKILRGKKVTCYPSFEKKMTGAIVLDEKVIKDGNIITSKGAGTTTDFALKIVETLRGADVVREIKKSFILTEVTKT